MSDARITIDGRSLTVPAGLSLRKAALKNGIYIPGLCSHPELNSFQPFAWSERIWQGSSEFAHDGAVEREDDFPHCDLCLVSINGGPPTRACTTHVEDGLTVVTQSPELTAARRESLKRILARHPHACLTCAQREGCDRLQCSMSVPVEERCCELLGKCEIGKIAEFIGIPPDTPSYKPESRAKITDEPLIRRNYELCISCLRCVRVCRDVRGVDALGAVSVGGKVFVGANAGATLPESLCRFCGACVEICPTGALLDQPGAAALIDGLAPCVAKCPLGVDVPGYLELIAQGLEYEALELIRQRAILPGVLGYACFHPCEDACRREGLDEPLSICALKRYASDLAGERPAQIYKAHPTGKHVAVIGGGPAGLAAAAEALRRGHDVTVFERETKLGGMLRQTIPGFRLPEAVIDRDLKHLYDLGVKVRSEVDFDHDIQVKELQSEGFDAVIVAVGLSEPMTLGVPGEELANVTTGLELLRQARRSEIERLAGDVIVIGGGNVAVDAAMTATRLGAASVTLICLEAAGQIPAYAEELQAALEEGVTVKNGWGVKTITGAARFQAVELKKCTRVFDERGKFNPAYDDAVREMVAGDHLIVAIGQKIEPAFKALLAEDRNVFWAGDAKTGPGSIVKAMADGVRAAREADLSLGGFDAPEAVKFPIGAKNIGRDPEFHHTVRAEMDHLPASERAQSFNIFASTLTSDQARIEAGRCLRCNLRAGMLKSPLPPDLWKAYAASLAGEIPATEGVLIMADETKKVCKIMGASDLKNAFEGLLVDDYQAAFCRWEIDSMYTKRESELIQTHLQAYGEMPGGDDMDDLF